MAEEDAFDPNSALDTEYTGELNRNLVPIPAGEHFARVKQGSVKARRFMSKAGNLCNMADLTFVFEGQDVIDATSMAEPSLIASLFLEMEPGTSRLITKEENPNANVQLGRLKYAVGLKEGRPWSLRSFEGLGCFVKVEHEPNPDDIEHPRSKIVGFYRDKKDSNGAAKKR